MENNPDTAPSALPRKHASLMTPEEISRIWEKAAEGWDPAMLDAMLRHIEAGRQEERELPQ